MHPPFGFALFYLRSVAPDKPYVDAHTGKTMEPVTTMQIYKGAIPFLLLQLSMVAILIAFPALVTGGLDKPVNVDMKAVEQQMLQDLNETDQSSDFNTLILPGASSDGSSGNAPAQGDSGLPGAGGDAGGSGFGPIGGEADDPMKAIQDSLGK